MTLNVSLFYVMKCHAKTAYGDVQKTPHFAPALHESSGRPYWCVFIPSNETPDGPQPSRFISFFLPSFHPSFQPKHSHIWPYSLPLQERLRKTSKQILETTTKVSPMTAGYKSALVSGKLIKNCRWRGKSQSLCQPLGTVRPLYRTGVSLLYRERFLYI